MEMALGHGQPPEFRYPALYELHPMQVSHAAGWDLRLRTLQCFPNGFLVRLDLRNALGIPANPGFPVLVVEAHDDHGERYRVWLNGGGHSVMPNGGVFWEVRYTFAPALTPEVRELHLRVTQLSLYESAVRAMLGDPVLTTVSAVWAFGVVLTPSL